MKKLTMLLLVLVLLLSMPLYGYGVIDYAEGPISYAPEAIGYDGSSILITGYFVNSSNMPVYGFESISMVVTADDGTPIAVSFDDASLKSLAVPIGTGVPFSFTIENPEQGKTFDQYVLDYEITGISVGNTVPLEAGKKVYYMGQKIVYDVPPTVISGRLLIPARLTFEKMGATVQWDAATQTVNIARDGVTINLKLGSDSMTVNGTPVGLEVPAQVVGGRTLVPMRAIIEQLGGRVYYNSETETAVIYE